MKTTTILSLSAAALLSGCACCDKPVAGNNGYFLVYQVSRALPTGDHAKDVDDARSMVLNDLKAKAVNALKAELLAASDTRLADEIMPVQDAK